MEKYGGDVCVLVYVCVCVYQYVCMYACMWYVSLCVYYMYVVVCMYIYVVVGMWCVRMYALCMCACIYVVHVFLCMSVCGICVCMYVVCVCVQFMCVCMWYVSLSACVYVCIGKDSVSGRARRPAGRSEPGQYWELAVCFRIYRSCMSIIYSPGDSEPQTKFTSFFVVVNPH